MKYGFLVLLLAFLWASCAHSPPLCGNAVFIFIEGDVRRVETNLRDDRLLRSDVVIRGVIREWRPGSLWKVKPYYTCSLEMDARVAISNLELSVEYGHSGDERYIKAPMFQSKSFVGKIKLPDFDVGGATPNARLTLHFGKEGYPLIREIEISEFLKNPPMSDVSK